MQGYHGQGSCLRQAAKPSPINGTQSQLSCKKTIPLDMWDVKDNCAKGRSKEALQINRELDNIKVVLFHETDQIVIVLQVFFQAVGHGGKGELGGEGEDECQDDFLHHHLLPKFAFVFKIFRKGIPLRGILLDIGLRMLVVDELQRIAIMQVVAGIALVLANRGIIQYKV